ncbi:hypothetical protein AB0F43_22075 [Kribbella sp. NPDC023972]|uniref:hypothetical protein n=1 Tax=Kribbella sp. NPDC023972 TaxID=3154795 RepID=UPI0033C88E60
MGRMVVAGVACLLMVAGCGSADQQLTDAAAQSAREAASEVGSAQLAVEQLLADKLWSRPANQMVRDAEKNLGKLTSSFESQQPQTDNSRRIYDQTEKALSDAQQAVTATRIALGNDDLGAASRQLAVLQRSEQTLDRIGELAQ